MSVLAVNRHTPVDATAGVVSMQLPTGAASGSRISVEKVDSTGNAVNVTGTIRGNTLTIGILFQYESLEFIAEPSGSWRPVLNHLPKAVVDAKIAAQAITDSALMDSKVSAAVAALVAASPAALDTLKELADAIGDDPNFATTVTNSLAGKANVVTVNPTVSS